MSTAGLESSKVDLNLYLTIFLWFYFIARAQAHQRSGGDTTMNYYLNQKKLLEVNPRHPLIKDLLRRVEDSKDDKTAVVSSSICSML